MNLTTRQLRTALAGTVAVATLAGAAVFVATAGGDDGSASADAPAASDAPTTDAGSGSPGLPPGALAPDAITGAPDARPVASEEGPGITAVADAGITEPEVFVDEPALPGEPGVIEGLDLPVDPSPRAERTHEAVALEPVPKAPPTAPAAPASTDLVDGEPGDPPGPGFPAPGGFQVTPSSGLGGLSSNFSGCAVQCVEHAILTPNLQTPNLGLEVQMKVPARIDITLTNEDTGDTRSFTSGTFKTQWTTTLSPLDAATPYHLRFEAFDQQNQKQVYTHEFVTTTPLDLPDQIAGNEAGCGLQCVTVGDVETTDRFDVVEVHVETNTPAVLRAYVSTSAPGWVGDAPLMPAESEVAVPAGLATDWTFAVDGLAADTTYHVVVKATDADDQTAFALGEFHTDDEPPADVRVTFQQVFVQWDGDPHWGGLDRGELSFAWGFDGQAIGTRAEEKMDGGTYFDLTSHNEQWFAIDRDGGTLPNVMVRGSERDWDADFGEFCATGNGIPSAPIHLDDCDTKTNVAQTGNLTLADIEALPYCTSIGFEGAGIHDRCAQVFTPDMGDDYAKFEVIVSFWIL